MNSPSMGEPANARRIAPWLTLFVLTALAGYLFWRGHGYYGGNPEARLDHPEYRQLRPSGPIGHGYGIVGTGLILTNLLYLVRRRLARLSIGSLRTWLDVHVVAGLAGALLVVFHSTFQLRTPIATTTAVSLGVLVGTGAIGLYIYRLLPRTGLLPFQERIREVEEVIPSFAKAVRVAVGAVHCTTLPHDVSLLRTLLTVPRWTLEARARRRAVTEAAESDPLIRKIRQDEHALVRNLVHELSDLAAAEVDANAGAALMRSWRSLHGFMAILMVLSVAVHVAVAWFYGYRWILSG
jgi:hypothetical protein